MLLPLKGYLCCSRPEFVLNRTDALMSVQRLLRYDICYHGGEYCHRVRESLEEILDKSSGEF